MKSDGVKAVAKAIPVMRVINCGQVHLTSATRLNAGVLGFFPQHDTYTMCEGELDDNPIIGLLGWDAKIYLTSLTSLPS